ncbi:MAG: helix-turn-helix transcriptional regulator [Pseudomonadota bacterium]
MSDETKTIETLRARLAAVEAENADLREQLEDAQDALAISEDRAAAALAGDENALIPWEVVELRLENGWTTLKAWRKHRGMTLDQLATACGVTKGHLSEIERGLKGMSLGLRNRLAQALDAPRAALWEVDAAADHSAAAE